MVLLVSLFSSIGNMTHDYLSIFVIIIIMIRLSSRDQTNVSTFSTCIDKTSIEIGLKLSFMGSK